MLKSLALEAINSRYPPEKWLHIYTDGSTMDNKSGAGITCPLFSTYQSVGEHSTNFDAEISAIYTSLQQLLYRIRHFTNAVILSDSSAAIQAITSSNCKSVQIKECQQIISQLEKLQKHLCFQWIPGHCGIEGNETADMLAKKGCNITQKKNITFPFSSIKQVITKKFRDFFRQELHNKATGKRWKHIIYNPEVIPKAPRKTAVARFRLITGHDYLSKHLNKIGLLDNPNCPLCNKEEEMTEDHLLTCDKLSVISSIEEKYWKARGLMASLPVARH